MDGIQTSVQLCDNTCAHMSTQTGTKSQQRGAVRLCAVLLVKSVQPLDKTKGEVELGWLRELL